MVFGPESVNIRYLDPPGKGLGLIQGRLRADLYKNYMAVSIGGGSFLWVSALLFDVYIKARVFLTFSCGWELQSMLCMVGPY